MRPGSVKVQEAEDESDGDGDGRVEGELAQSDEEVAQAQAESETDIIELTDAEQGVDSGVEQKDFVEDGEMRGPCGFEPAKIDGEPEDGEDEVVAPGAVLRSVAAGVPHERSDGNGKNGVEREPVPMKGVSGAGDQNIRDAEDGGKQKLCGLWKPLRSGGDFGEECGGKVRSKRKESRENDQRSEHKGKVGSLLLPRHEKIVQEIHCFPI